MSGKGDNIKEIGESITNLGCGITILVLVGVFLWFAFKFC
jgi:hypothetical protein